MSIADLESRKDQLAMTAEATNTNRTAATEADRPLFDEVFRDLQEAMRAATTAHSRLVSADALVQPLIDGYFGASGDRAAEISDLDDAYDELIADLAPMLGLGEVALGNRITSIEDLGSLLRTAVSNATSAVDSARDAWIDAQADVAKKTLALERLRTRILGLAPGFTATVEESNAAIAEARRLMARDEESNSRAAAVWAFFARQARDRLTANFDSTDDGLDSDAADANVFRTPWETAWGELVDAQDLLHERSVALHQARLAEAIAVEALREHERGLPYADLSSVFP